MRQVDLDAARTAYTTRHPSLKPVDDRAIAQRILRELDRKAKGLVHDERTVAIYEEWRRQ